MDNLEERIDKVNLEMFADGDTEEISETEEVVSSNQPTDLLQTQRNAWRDAEPRRARGSRPKIKLDMTAVDNSGIRQQYKKTKDDSDYYNSIGNKQYSSMVKQQYMQDHFLPAIDAMVKLNGMEAMLANKEVLADLDALTLLDGTRGSGYTEAFIRSMYKPESNAMGVVERSDAQVEQAVRDIKYLCETDQIRSAVGKAKEIKRSIDNGENVASEDDYEIVQKVALYGQ